MIVKVVVVVVVLLIIIMGVVGESVILFITKYKCKDWVVKHENQLYLTKR